MRGNSCSPKLSAHPLTHTPRWAKRLQVCSPLAQTIWLLSIFQLGGKASALAIHRAVPFGGQSTDILSEVNRRADESCGHNSCFKAFSGRPDVGSSEQEFRTTPSSVKPRRKVISPKGLRN